MASHSISNRGGNKAKKRKEGQAASEFDQSEDDSARDRSGEAVEETSGYISEGIGQVRDQVQSMTRGREGSIVAVALAVGFGMGVAIGTSLASPRRRPPTWKDRFMAEGIGRRMMERLEGMVPCSNN